MLKRHRDFFLLALLVLSTLVQAQDPEALIQQLTGKAEGPQRNEAELSAAYDRAIAYLLPRMTAQDVKSQYVYQIMLQDMGSYASRPGAETERRVFSLALVKSLSEDKPSRVLQNWYLLQLQRVGGAEVVRSLLTQLMDSNPQTRDYARRALEVIPDPSAGQALAQTLDQATDPAWQAALIRSLGARAEAAGTPPIIRILHRQDPQTAAVAIKALALVGDDTCVNALLAAYEKANPAQQSNICHALLDIAWTRLQKDPKDAAAKLYQTIYELSITKQVQSLHCAALTGLVQYRLDQGTQEILALMQHEDPQYHRMSAYAAATAPTKALIETLASMFPTLAPDAQIQVLGLIESQRQTALLPYVRPLLSAENPTNVRLAAISTIIISDQAEDVKTLLTLSKERSATIHKACLQALTRIHGADIDTVIHEQAAAGPDHERTIAISLFGTRHMPNEVDSLLTYANENKRIIARTALKTLQLLASEEDIPALVRLIANTDKPSTRSDAVTTLRVVLGRTTNMEAATAVLAEAMTSATPETQAALLSTLSAIGDKAALAIVLTNLNNANLTIKEAALRALCDWPDFAAGEHLLNVIGDSQATLKDHVLAIRGLARLVETSDAPDNQRAELGVAAFEKARRAEEKILIIAALANVPSEAARQKLLSLAQTDEFSTAARHALENLGSGTSIENKKPETKR